MTFSIIDDFYVTDKEITQENPTCSCCTTSGPVSLEDERALRYYGCGLIWEACRRLALPMSVACTAQVLFHRFYCKNSMQMYDVRVMSTSVFWMACKLEEVIDCDDVQCLRLRDVLMMFYDCILRREYDQGGNQEPYLLDIYSGFYSLFKEEVIKMERDMLRCFGFVTHVEHAHPFVLTLGAQLGLGSQKHILQSACNIVNDSLRTTLCVRVKAEFVACSALFLAAEKHGQCLPHGWWEGCHVDWATLKMCCTTILHLYKESRAESSYLDISSSETPFLPFDIKHTVQARSKVRTPM